MRLRTSDFPLCEVPNAKMTNSVVSLGKGSVGTGLRSLCERLARVMRALRREIAADIGGWRTCRQERFIGMRARARRGLAGAISVNTYG